MEEGGGLASCFSSTLATTPTATGWHAGRLLDSRGGHSGGGHPSDIFSVRLRLRQSTTKTSLLGNFQPVAKSIGDASLKQKLKTPRALTRNYPQKGLLLSKHVRGVSRPGSTRLRRTKQDRPPSSRQLPPAASLRRPYFTCSMTLSSRVPSLWSTSPLTTREGQVRHTPSLQSWGSSMSLSRAASNMLVLSSTSKTVDFPSCCVGTRDIDGGVGDGGGVRGRARGGPGASEARAKGLRGGGEPHQDGFGIVRNLFLLYYESVGWLFGWSVGRSDRRYRCRT